MFVLIAENLILITFRLGGPQTDGEGSETFNWLHLAEV